jgi:hypothetical protein
MATLIHELHHFNPALGPSPDSGSNGCSKLPPASDDDMRFVAANDDKGVTLQSNMTSSISHTADPERRGTRSLTTTMSWAYETEIQTAINSLKKISCPLRAIMWRL